MSVTTGKPRPVLAGQTAAERYYEVFARRDSADPLTHVGSVEAPNAELAQVRAWYVYDQHRWLEMCVVPTAAIVPLRPSGGQSAIKAV
jgi:1,2-phenylacetyl-CoA epoxidase PaaB subunit